MQGDPDEPADVEECDERDADLGADEVADSQPVADLRVVRVQRGQDHVEVEEVGHREDRIRDSPARRDRREDRPDREEREEVALVDTRRDDEERDRDDGRADEDRLAVRPPHDDEEDRAEHDGHEHAGDEDRRLPGDEDLGPGRAGRVRRGAGNGVAQPLAARGEAGPGALDERPWVVGVDGDVRVATRGLEHLVDEPREVEPERQREPDRRGQAGERGGREADRSPPIDEPRGEGGSSSGIVG